MVRLKYVTYDIRKMLRCCLLIVFHKVEHVPINLPKNLRFSKIDNLSKKKLLKK